MAPHRYLWTSAAVSALLVLQSQTAFAQTATGAESGEFIGELVIGGKRDVDTATATSTTTVNQEEILDRQASTIAELIDSVPGVALVNGATPAGSGINIRGFGANGTYGTDSKVAIIVDGASKGAEEIYRVGNQLFTDPALYKTISVNRGTVGSFEYGSGIIGGVVIADTKDASDFTGGEVSLKFRQTLGYQSNGSGFVSSSILAWQPAENLEFLANFTYRESDDYRNGAGDIEEDTSSAPYNGLVKGKFTFGDDDQHAVTLSYGEFLAIEKDVPYVTFRDVDFGNLDKRETYDRTGVLRYEFNPAGNDLVDLEVALTYSDQEINQFLPGGGFLAAKLRYENTSLLIKNTSVFSTGAWDHNVRAGVEFIRKKRKDAPAAPGGTAHRTALFVVADSEIGGLTLSPSLRWETQSIDPENEPFGGSSDLDFEHDAVMGGLSAHYQFENGFSVFGSAAYSESLPIIDDLPSSSRSNRDFISTSEKSETYELGFGYDGESVFTDGDTLAFKLTAYSTDFWDNTSYFGVKDVDFKGVEVEASYALANGFYTDFNAAYQNATQVSTSDVEGPFSNEQQTVGRITFGQRFDDTLDLSWEVAMADDYTRGSAEDKGYTVHNWRATYTPDNGPLAGFEVRASLENVFDREYTPKVATYAQPGTNFKFTVAKTW
ncbi:MAG: TonB-dependent receptor plug domain-containing protein [Marinovum sp.]|nr:TonB-dependent receptor plug domain-containing protein [Marinovum sp.]